MIERTMNARKVRLASKTFCVLSLSVGILLLSEVGASLLDPTQIGRELQKFARDALGVDEMQNYFDSLQYQKRTIKGGEITPHLAVKLSDKFKTRFEVAKRLKKAVEDSYARSAKATPQTECCHVNKSTLKYDVRFHSRVDLENVCLKISGSAYPNPIHLDEGVFTEMKDISKTYPFIKWQYFGSEQGVMTNFPVFDDKEECDKYDPRYRPFYVETATPEAKDVVLVVDISASMTGEKLYIATEAAKTVLDTMNPKDQVGIVAFNNYASTPGDVGGKSRCYSERLALAIPTNIIRMKSYVDGLVPHGQTQYRLAFEKAFSLLKGSVSEESGEKKKRVIIFLTDGAPSDARKELIFHTIRDNNFALNNSVIILTYGFGSAVNQTILQDIAKQNTAKYGALANTSVGDITPGEYTHVEDIENLRIKMGMYYNLFALGKQLDPVVSVPYVDAFGTGLLMSITLPCFHEGKFIGVAGTDINMDDLLSDITFFNQGQSTYAFMISNSGRTLIHPLLPAPTDAYGDPVFLDIRTLEPETEFAEVFDSIKRGESGSKEFVAKRSLPRGAKEKEGVTVKEVNSRYFWRPLAGIDFSVGVVVPVSHGEDQLTSLKIPADYTFKYHRIDLNHPDKPCSQFGTYAAKETTVVKFAPGAFKDPYEYIGKDETKADVELLTAYMKDETGRVTDPGLKSGIRDTVIATWNVEALWLRDKTELTQYLVWRYIGTSNGVFRSTPGSVADKGYDPRQRPWYYTALAHTGLLTLTTPYLDSGGAGVVITAGRALYRGEPSHIHHTNDEVLGVMGADFPLTYFHRLLTEVYPKCKETQTYSCFVMDSAGFLIMHEDFLLSSAEASDVEYVHITEKDKYVAEDLINKGYLRKKGCRDLEEIQMQSFYEVSLPSGGIDALGSGGRCSKYQLGQIVGTNAFIGVAVRESLCSAEPCPCSLDRECSLFNLTCECPCTSPLDFHYCRSQFLGSSVPICPPSAPEIQPTSNQNSPVPKKMCKDPTSGLEKCFDPRCSERNSSQKCEGVVGCYWCKNDKDDVPLKQPYCASSEVCFRGREAEQEQCPLEGPKTTSQPYQVNKTRDKFVGDGEGRRTGVIVGTVVGCTAVVALIVIITILVIRHRRNQGGPPIDKNRSASTQQIIDLENPDVATRPPAPLPEREDVGSDEDYDDPDELQPSRKPSVISIQWPSPYDEIRTRPNSKPPALPPARKQSTTSNQIIPRPLSYPTSYPERGRDIATSGYPEPPVSQIRRPSGAAMNTTPPNAVTRVSSTDSEVPDVPKKKRKSLVIPPPPISEEKGQFKGKPLTSTSNTKVPPGGLFSQAASEKGERQYSNFPSPRPEPKSPSDTRLMPPITEAMEQSISNRPGLVQHASCDSIALDPHGYIKFIPSEGTTLFEDQPLGPASEPNVLPDGPSSSAVLNSPVSEPRYPSDTNSIPNTAEATEQFVSNRPGLPQRESCNSISLDPEGYVKCISQKAPPDTTC